MFFLCTDQFCPVCKHYSTTANETSERRRVCMSLRRRREERVRTCNWYWCINTAEEVFWNHFRYFSMDMYPNMYIFDNTCVQLGQLLQMFLWWFPHFYFGLTCIINCKLCVFFTHSEELSCQRHVYMQLLSLSMAGTLLPAALASKQPGSNWKDVRLTGRSPVWAVHAENLLIPVLGQSVHIQL